MRRICWWVLVGVCAWLDAQAPANGVSTAIAPLVAAALIAAGGAISAGVNSKNQRKASETDAVLTREQLAQREAEGMRDTAAAEATQNPFRDQLNQAQTLGRLDLMARSRLTPTKITPHARYAGAVPERSGGLSYDMDPQVRQMAELLKSDVASGRGAPSMTNAANYGKTGALDLRALMALQGGAGAVPPPRRASGASGVSFDGDVEGETVRDMLARRRLSRIA